MTIPLGSYPGPGRAASWRALFALHRTGFGEPPRRRGRWWALTPPFHPYLRRLRRYVEGGLLSVPLSVGFRPLACASVLPCGVRTFLDRPPSERSAARGHPACVPNSSSRALGEERIPCPSCAPHSGQKTTPSRACITNSPQTMHSSEAPRRSAASSWSSVRANGERGSPGSELTEDPDDLSEDLDVVGVDRLERRVLGLEADAAAPRGRRS